MKGPGYEHKQAQEHDPNQVAVEGDAAIVPLSVLNWQGYGRKQSTSVTALAWRRGAMVACFVAICALAAFRIIQTSSQEVHVLFKVIT
jgi:hypothetical protein